MLKKPLELSLYVAGAGAFGVFLRWLQDQLAFNEAGLVDKSAFNVMVPVFVAVAALLFRHFLRNEERASCFIPEEFDLALAQERLIYRIARVAIGVLMVLGSLLLIATTELDKLVRMLRVLAVLGVITGVSFPVLLAQVGKARRSNALLCILSTVPVVFFAVWMLYVYRANSINSVIWAYVLELCCTAMGMAAFYRVAGLCYGMVKGRRTRFDLMLGAVIFIMALADERYMALQVMLLAAALMMIYYNWVLTENLEKREKKKEPEPQDGFERL